MTPRGSRSDGNPIHDDDRARHLRRGHDGERDVDRQDQQRPSVRPARAHRLRRHHRRRRGAEHRPSASGRDRSRSSAAGVSAMLGAAGRHASPAPAASSRSTRATRRRRPPSSRARPTYVDSTQGDPVAQVQALTGGRGVDYAFEVIGLPETTLQAYNMARKGGTAVMVGMTRSDAQLTIPTFDLFFNEKTLKGCKYGSAQVRRDFQRFVDLIETGRLDTESMVSRTSSSTRSTTPSARWRTARSSAASSPRSEPPVSEREQEVRVVPGALGHGTPDKAAVIMAESGETVTYRQLDDRSNQCAQCSGTRGCASAITSRC